MMTSLPTIAILLSVVFVCKSTQDNPTVIAFKQLNQKLVQSYDKLISPKLGESSPLEVGVTLYLLDFGICPKDKELSIDFYFRQSWNDERLKSESGINITGGQELVDKIWIPDTFFSSISSIKAIRYPTPNIFVKISWTGHVLLSQRFQSTVRCLQLSNDLKGVNCSLDIESYGHKSSDIHYKWSKGQESIGVTEFEDTSEYKLVEYKTAEQTVHLASGNYSRIEAQFSFAKTGNKYQRTHFGI